MIIEKLVLKDFRNFSSLVFDDLSPAVNLLVGENAQGKTNLIEAVNYLSCLKSFRGAGEAQLIREGCKSAYLAVSYRMASHGGKVEAALFSGEKRSVKVGGIPIRRVGELMGVINTVVFAPEDLKTVKESPSLRRRLLDMEISKIRPLYYADLQRYAICIKQKNRLLKEQRVDDALLDTFNETAAEAGAKIIRRRAKFVEMLAKEAAAIHAQLTDGGEKLEISYKGCVEGENLQEALIHKLAENREREKELRVSLIGPHREDLSIQVNGRDSKLYSSQGQQRTAMLSIKLACAQIAWHSTGERPVILLDDVFSELDISRRERLLSIIKKNQVFITSTDISGIKDVRGAKIFKVSGGQIFL